MNNKYKYIFKVKVVFCLMALFLPAFVYSAEDINSKTDTVAESRKSRVARIFGNSFDPYKVDPSLELPTYNFDNQLKSKTSKPFKDVKKEIKFSDFQIPLPPQSELLDGQPPVPLVGEGGIGQMYHIKDSPKQVEEFYRWSLKGQGFEEIKNKSFKIMAVKRLRFERRDTALELYLTPIEGEDCNFIIVKYADRDGISKAEAEPLALGSFPKKDNSTGSDLEDIPRPLGSVRLSGGTPKNKTNFSYTLPLSVLQARDFYLKQMPSAGWILVDEVNLRQLAASYAKEHRGKQLVPSLFIGSKLDLGEIIKDSYILDFSSKTATASFTIYSNFLNPASGSIVDIAYKISQNREER